MKEYSIDERMKICRECPIYHNGRCNSNLWLNHDTNEVSTFAKPKFIRGCNCVISIKARNLINHCVAGKW